MDTPRITCPQCGSDQLHAGKKGFSGKKAVAGAALAGGVGLLAGTIGSNKITITCLNCGNQFRPGEKDEPPTVKKEPSPRATRTILIILGVMMILVAAALLAAQAYGFCITLSLFAILLFLRASKIKILKD